MPRTLTTLLCHPAFQQRLAALKARLGDQRGASTVEYGLLIAVIVVGVISAATVIFDPLQQYFTDIINEISQLATGSGG